MYTTFLQLAKISGNPDPSTCSSHSSSDSVGHSDHSYLPLGFIVNSTDTFDNFARNTTLQQDLLVQWEETRTGLLVDNYENHIGWLRIPDNSSIFEKFSDPAAGSNAPHFELIFGNGLFTTVPPTGNFFTVATVVVSPAARAYLVSV